MADKKNAPVPAVPVKANNVSTWALLGAVLGLVVGISIGYLAKAPSTETSSTTVTERYDNLNTDVYTNIYAIADGEVTKIKADQITLTKGDSEANFSLQESEKQNIQLLVKETVSDEDQKAWDEYLAKQEEFNQDMQDYSTRIAELVNDNKPTEGVQMPTPPEQIAYSIQSEYVMDEQGMPVENKFKFTSSVIQYDEIKAGDMLQLRFNKDTNGTGNMLLEGITVTRDLRAK